MYVCVCVVCGVGVVHVEVCGLFVCVVWYVCDVWCVVCVDGCGWCGMGEYMVYVCVGGMCVVCVCVWYVWYGMYGYVVCV